MKIKLSKRKCKQIRQHGKQKDKETDTTGEKN